MTESKREAYLKLFHKGYYLDVEQECFYSRLPVDKFVKPDGVEFDNWEVKPFEQMAYYNSRVLAELNISEDDNSVMLYENERKQGKLIKNKIFTANKFGDIEIGLYGLDRVPFTYHKTQTSHTNIVEKYDVITRYTPWRTQLQGRKYHITGETGTHPFLHPKLIDAYENKTEITTLVITEGAFKAFKATHEGVYTVGLSSITHGTDKEEGTIHGDIIKIIRACSVQNVVILWDGDCLDISLNALREEEDLIKRPLSFYSSAKKLRDQLKEFISKETKVFFAHIDSKRLSNGYPKGIDDLFVNYDKSVEAIIEDFEKIGTMPGRFIKWLDISLNSKMKRFFAYFKINNVEQFYERHRLKITDKTFLLNGTTYKYNYEKSEIDVLVPASAKEYMRIGTEYYHEPKVLTSVGVVGKELLKWKQTTIIQDHGKKFLEHIPKYKKFINKPSHDKYEKIIQNCYNTYYELDHQPQKGSWAHIKSFLKHIFEEHYEFGMDYLQLLYCNPEQKLPILCLVSKENETGKSTFINLLKWIFQNNMAIIGNNELESDFNSGWITKLIIASEETFLDKKTTMEKIKSMSTAETMSMNQKSVDLLQVAFYGKFVFASNNEDTFIKISKEDKRYWIRKIKSIPKGDLDPLFNDKMKAEIPSFIHYLLDREMFVPKKLGRMWFDTDALRTDAFYKVAKQSRPTLEKEIRMHLSDMFLDFNLTEIEMTIKDIRDLFSLGKYQNNYIKSVLIDNLKVGLSKNPDGIVKNKRYEIPYWGYDEDDILYHKRNGRPYLFKRKDFINEPTKIDSKIKFKEPVEDLPF